MKKFITPTINISLFEAENITTTSGEAAKVEVMKATILRDNGMQGVSSNTLHFTF